MKSDMKSWKSVASRPAAALIACLLALMLVFSLLGDDRAPLLVPKIPGIRVTTDSGEHTAMAALPNDKFLGGLLSPEFDEQSCWSRYQSAFYRKPSPHILSSYLLLKLRKYEALHKRCGPNTALFNRSVEQLKLNHSTSGLECSYVLWSPFGGLGNRMLTLASTFLYALLTDRVMLVDRVDDMEDVFCEPFPGTTWFTPPGLPVERLDRYDIGSDKSYGYMIDHKLISEDPAAPAESLPPFVYVHIQYNYRDGRHPRFFRDDAQSVLRKVNWMLMKSDNYVAPGLFMIPQFMEELAAMFPLKETVFHHLGRYLFHPTNTVWGMVTRYHNSYLAKAKQRVGIQVRSFSWARISTEDYFKQIISCTKNENLLPDVNDKEPAQTVVSEDGGDGGRSKTAVLVVSLYSEYYEKLKEMYYEHGTVGGDMVSVYQPTHEERQQTDKQSHNQKALAEICLLSFSDVFVTTAASTFGYVSFGLSGTKPWFLMSAHDGKVPDPPCRRGVSMEPCFHSPPNVDPRTGCWADTGRMVPFVRHCEDFGSGVKLIN